MVGPTVKTAALGLRRVFYALSATTRRLSQRAYDRLAVLPARPGIGRHTRSHRTYVRFSVAVWCAWDRFSGHQTAVAGPSLLHHHQWSRRLSLGESGGLCEVASAKPAARAAGQRDVA